MTITQSGVTPQGQNPVPADVRRRLGIGPGPALEWAEEGGQIVVRRAGRYSSADIHEAVFGSEAPKPREAGAMKTGIRRHLRKRYARG